jgi:hypothetical protein
MQEDSGASALISNGQLHPHQLTQCHNISN